MYSLRAAAMFNCALPHIPYSPCALFSVSPSLPAPTHTRELLYVTDSVPSSLARVMLHLYFLLQVNVLASPYTYVPLLSFAVITGTCCTILRPQTQTIEITIHWCKTIFLSSYRGRCLEDVRLLRWRY
jgi:hypothetical protein